MSATDIYESLTSVARIINHSIARQSSRIHNVTLLTNRFPEFEWIVAY
jgi:hypothetical protein